MERRCWAEFGELRRQIKIALEIGAVDDVENDVRPLVGEIIPRDDLLRRVGRERVDAGQVRDGHALVLFEVSFLFLDGNARPVADELVRAGQRVEQRRFAGIGVAGECDSEIHIDILSCPDNFLFC